MWKGANLGTPQVTTQIQHFTSGRAVFLEAVLTFILVYTVFATAVDERGSFKQLSGLPIGLAIAVDILIGGLFTGAAMNPARAFGPALWSGTWTNFFLVYVLGPITGGILAASVYWFAFLRNGPDDVALEEAAAEETGGEEAVLESVLASEADAAAAEAMLGSADPATEDRPGGASDTDGADDGAPSSGAPG
jgi:hypothetical protein